MQARGVLDEDGAARSTAIEVAAPPADRDGAVGAVERQGDVHGFLARIGEVQRRGQARRHGDRGTIEERSGRGRPGHVGGHGAGVARGVGGGAGRPDDRSVGLEHHGVGARLEAAERHVDDAAALQGHRDLRAGLTRVGPHRDTDLHGLIAGRQHAHGRELVALGLVLLRGDATRRGDDESGDHLLGGGRGDGRERARRRSARGRRTIVCSRLAAIGPPVLVTCTTGDTTFGASPASESTRWLRAGTVIPIADGASTGPASLITRTSTVDATSPGFASSTRLDRPTSVAPPTSHASAVASMQADAAKPEISSVDDRLRLRRREHAGSHGAGCGGDDEGGPVGSGVGIPGRVEAGLLDRRVGGVAAVTTEVAPNEEARRGIRGVVGEHEQRPGAHPHLTALLGLHDDRGRLDAEARALDGVGREDGRRRRARRRRVPRRRGRCRAGTLTIRRASSPPRLGVGLGSDSSPSDPGAASPSVRCRDRRAPSHPPPASAPASASASASAAASASAGVAAVAPSSPVDADRTRGLPARGAATARVRRGLRSGSRPAPVGIESSSAEPTTMSCPIVIHSVQGAPASSGIAAAGASGSAAANRQSVPKSVSPTATSAAFSSSATRARSAAASASRSSATPGAGGSSSTKATPNSSIAASASKPLRDARLPARIGELLLRLRELLARLGEGRLLVERLPRAALEGRPDAAVVERLDLERRHPRVGLRLGGDEGGHRPLVGGRTATAESRSRPRVGSTAATAPTDTTSQAIGGPPRGSASSASTAASTRPSHARLRPAPVQSGTAASPAAATASAVAPTAVAKPSAATAECEQGPAEPGCGDGGHAPRSRAARARTARMTGAGTSSAAVPPNAVSQPPQPATGCPSASCHVVGAALPTRQSRIGEECERCPATDLLAR